MAECFIKHPTYGRVPMNWWLPMYRGGDDGLEYTSKFEIAFDGHGRATLRSPHRPAASFPIGSVPIKLGEGEHAPAHVMLTSAFPYIRPTGIVKYIDGDITNLSITNLIWSLSFTCAKDPSSVSASSGGRKGVSGDSMSPGQGVSGDSMSPAVHPLYGSVAVGAWMPLHGRRSPLLGYEISFTAEGDAAIRSPSGVISLLNQNVTTVRIGGMDFAKSVLMLASAFPFSARPDREVGYIDDDPSNKSLLNLRWAGPLKPDKATVFELRGGHRLLVCKPRCHNQPAASFAWFVDTFNDRMLPPANCTFFDGDGNKILPENYGVYMAFSGDFLVKIDDQEVLKCGPLSST